MARHTQHEWFSFQRLVSRRRESRRRSGTQPYHRRLRLEPLEDRRLLATFMVGNLNDAGAGSLRQAILDANGLAGADTIGFGSVVGTIALSSGEMEITEAITINGPGDELLTIDAQENSRILNISAVTGDFTIGGLTLTGGSTTGDNVDYYDTTFNGGAIRSLSTGNLTITDSTVSGSHTAGYVAAGGGVYAVGNVTITNSTISGNHTTGYGASGGGVFAYGDVTVTGSDVSGNSTMGKYAGGGGIQGYSIVTLTNSTLNGNHTLGESAGGGGVSGYGDVSLTSSTVSGNHTMGEYASGGGIFSGANVNLIHSTISGNYTQGSRANGGGVNCNAVGTLIDSTVSENHTEAEGSQGGGVYFHGSATLANSTISDNYTVGVFSSGGGVYGYSDLTLNNCTVSGNRTAGNNSSGGGICQSGVLTLTNSTVSGNHTAGENSYGGGVFGLGDLTLVGSIISDNYTTGGSAFGGGVLRSGTVTVTDSTISGNHTAGEMAQGGGILSGAHLTLVNSTVQGNYTTGYAARGGGIRAISGVTLTGSTVSGNHTAGAGATGAGIRAEADVTLTNSTVSGNHSTGDYAWGGGMFTYGDFTLISSTVTGNHTHGTFATGAGLFLSQYSALTMFNSILAGNTVDNGGRPDLHMIGSVPPVLHFSLVGNNFGAALLVPAPLGSPDANGNFIGTAVSPINPLLGPLADNGGPTLPDGSKILTHAPLPGSPVVDTGDPAIAFNPSQFDERGAPYSRVYNGDGAGGSRIDMGAVEKQPIIPPPALLGDYNHDNVVDAVDYTVWRNTLGTGGLAAYAGADGNGNGSIGPEDYLVWKTHYGETLPPPAMGGGNVVAVTLAESVGSGVELSASTGDRGQFISVSQFAFDAGPTTHPRTGAPHAVDAPKAVAARQDFALLAWVASSNGAEPDDSADLVRQLTPSLSECSNVSGVAVLEAAFGEWNSRE
jgi:hypothetical protein